MVRIAVISVMVWVTVAGGMETARAAQVSQLQPNIPEGAAHVYLNIGLTNNDPGAIYNSGTLDAALLGGLAEQLYALPVNTHTFDSPQEMMGDWLITILPPPSGDVCNGWNAAVATDDAAPGQVVLTNIGGIPGLSYDQWVSGHTMALTLRIPLNQLEVDGRDGYDPNRDAKIVLTETTLQQAFVGYDGGAGFHSPAYLYGVVWPGVDCAAANVSGSGTVGLADVAMLAAMWLEQGLFLNADINKDGRVDLKDLAEIARWWGQTCEF